MLKTLILVDIQNDFLPGGPMGVNKGNQVVDVANRIMPLFPLVVASQDWHPANHTSFADNHPGHEPGETIEWQSLEQILWPVHCVQRTRGAALADGLDTTRITQVFQKGMDPDIDSYSAFYDNGHTHSTGLSDWLRQQGAGPLYVMGLATDYCVKYTALDSVRDGFRTFLIEEGCRGVDLHPGDVERAVEEMSEAGVSILDHSSKTESLEMKL